MGLVIPENKYFPSEGEVVSNIVVYQANQLMQGGITEFDRGFQTVIYSKILQLIDDSSSWIVG